MLLVLSAFFLLELDDFSIGLVHYFHTAMSHDNAEESANESSVFFCLLRASLENNIDRAS